LFARDFSVERDIRERERRIIEPRLERECRRVDLADDAPGFLFAQERTVDADDARLANFAAYREALDRTRQRCAEPHRQLRLQLDGAVGFELQPQGARRDELQIALRIESLRVDLEFTNAQTPWADRHAAGDAFGLD